MLIERDETLFAQQQVVRLQALLEASRRIHSTIALDEVLRAALQIVVRELELTGAFFTHFPEFYGDVPPEWLDTSPDAVQPVFSSLCESFPLRDKSGAVFTRLVVIRPEGRVLTLDELDFLESLAVQAAVAIENARFHERTIEWQRIESDLESARVVQRSLLPQQMPEIPGYALALRSVACYAVGGDYLDIVPMASGRTTFVVADVAGKGLTSALISTSFRSAFRAMVHAGLPLLEIATRINLLHYNEGPESRRRYVTAFFCELDPATDTILVVNAGHNPAFLATCGEPSRVTLIAASGAPIGMVPASAYEVEKYSLPKGARLLLYTDGLTEIFRGDREAAFDEFGEANLLASFVHCASTQPEQVLDALWSAIGAFRGQDDNVQEQSDDMTALVLLRQV